MSVWNQKNGTNTNHDETNRLTSTGAQRESLYIDSLPIQERDGATKSGNNVIRNNQYHSNYNNIFDVIVSYISTFFYLYPITVSIIFSIIAIFGSILLASLIYNPVIEIGMINDNIFNVSQITSIVNITDLYKNNITHYCYTSTYRKRQKAKIQDTQEIITYEDPNKCLCTDPFTPISNSHESTWLETLRHNKMSIEKHRHTQLDLVIYGESTVEIMDGEWQGRKGGATGLNLLHEHFQKHFNKDSGGLLNGLALGISGDTAPNVLWRLTEHNGIELPEYLNPKIIWLHIGGNDIGKLKCSEEVVILGILRIVQEILIRKPNCHIVINSLFPMTTTRDGIHALFDQYENRRIRHYTKRNRKLRHHNNNYNKSENFIEYDESLLLDSIFEQMLMESEKDIEADITIEQLTRHNNQTYRQQQADNIKEQVQQYEDTRRLRNKDPILRDGKTKFRKYTPGTGFIHQTAIPLWPLIRIINIHLEQFANHPNHNKRVHYFDSSAIFIKNRRSNNNNNNNVTTSTQKITTTTTKRRKKNQFVMRSENISPAGYPTVTGIKLWEDAIVAYCMKLLNQMKIEQPELFTDDPSSTQQKDLITPEVANIHTNTLNELDIQLELYDEIVDINQPEMFNDDMYMNENDYDDDD